MTLDNGNDTPVNSRKNLKVTKCKSMQDLVKQLVAEGMELLDHEEKQKTMSTKSAFDKFFETDSKPETKPVSKKETPKSNSKNPYQIAREQLLSKMEEYRRKEILEMESTGNTDNRFYEDFVNEVTKLGDSLLQL